MKTPEEIKLVTVGALTKDLKRFAKKHADDDVACYSTDGDVYYVENSGIDDDGDLWIGVSDEEYDGGYYTVDMLLNDLEGYSSTTRVYMAGIDECLAVEVDAQGHIFAYDDENEVVACDCSLFEPDDEPEPVHKPQRRPGKANGPKGGKERRKAKGTSTLETVVLAILTLLLAVGLAYNVYALVAGTEPVLKSIFWSVVCLVLTVIGSLTLYYSKNE